MTYLSRKLLNTKQQVIFYNTTIVHININMYSFLCNILTKKARNWDNLPKLETVTRHLLPDLSDSEQTKFAVSGLSHHPEPDWIMIASDWLRGEHKK